jgi:hypothetical protein
MKMGEMVTLSGNAEDGWKRTLDFFHKQLN